MQIQNRFKNDAFFIFAMLLVMVVCYGLLMTGLGFYWDDWQMIYLSEVGSPGIFWQHFLIDRPFVTWIYLLTTFLVNNTPLRSHLFTLLVRWLSVVGFYWALRGLWPKSLWSARWMALLLAVFPGFFQQPVSFTYGAHFTTYALFTFSLAFMVWSVRRPNHFWAYSIPAWIMTCLHIFSMEYFIGLELLRPVILWILFHQKGEKWLRTLRRVIIAWLPYAFALLAFGAWRVWIFPVLSNYSTSNTPTILINLFSQPVQALTALIQITLQDLLNLLVGVWAATLSPDQIEITSKMFWLAWFTGGVTAACLIWLSSNSDQESISPDEESLTAQALIIGTLGILGGGLPIWLTNRQAVAGSWSDRFALAPMLGAVMVVVGVVIWLVSDHRRRAIVFSLLIAFSLTVHIQSANKFRLNWNLQRDYLWQLSWRAPSLQPGTAVVGPSLPFSYMGDYSLGFALNRVYTHTLEDGQVAYWWINGLRNLGSRILPGLEAGLPIQDDFRNVHFASSTSQSLVVAYNNARGCLRVLDDAYQDAPAIDNESKLLPISHVKQIQPAGQMSDTAARILGPEPAHTWCYYYQKADLARQFENWDQVVQLADEAAQKGYSPKNGVEWIPFIEGFAQQSRWEQAAQTTLAAAQQTAKLEPALCSTWARITQQTVDSPEKQAALDEIRAALACVP